MLWNQKKLKLALEPGVELIEIYNGVPILYYSRMKFPSRVREYEYSLCGRHPCKNVKSAYSRIRQTLNRLGVRCDGKKYERGERFVLSRGKSLSMYKKTVHSARFH